MRTVTSVYSAGELESIVGKALERRRADVVLATTVAIAIGNAKGPGG